MYLSNHARQAVNMAVFAPGAIGSGMSGRKLQWIRMTPAINGNLRMQLFRQGKDIRYISDKTGRSQTAVAKRLGKLLSQA